MDDESTTLNMSYVGKEYVSSPWLVSAESMKQYAQATNESNPRYYVESSDDLVPPPLYPVVFIPGVLGQLKNDADDMKLDILRIVHGEHEMWWKGQIRPGDTIISKGKIMAIKKLGPNELLDIHIECFRENEVLVEMRYKLIMRGTGKSDSKKQPTSSRETPPRKKLTEGTILVSDDQGIRYADASGDHNPIHTSDEIAKSAGFPRMILQGLCTMALASQVVVSNLLDGNPLRLQYMKVRFAKPVLMGDALTTEVYEGGVKKDGLHQVYFETKNPSGVFVLTNGEAHFDE